MGVRHATFVDEVRFHVTGGWAELETPEPWAPRNEGQLPGSRGGATLCAYTPAVSRTANARGRSRDVRISGGRAILFDRHAGHPAGRQFLIDHQQTHSAV